MDEFLFLEEGDVVEYLANMPYGLSNGQEATYEGEELVIKSNVSVQSKFFNFKSKEIKENNQNQTDVTPDTPDLKQNDENDSKDSKEDENEKNEEINVENKEKSLDEMNKDELIAYAEENNIDVDKRKGAKRILEEIKNFKN